MLNYFAKKIFGSSNDRVLKRFYPIVEKINTLEKNFSNKDGKIYSTFEIAWLLGWKYDENQPKPLTPGSGEKNLEEAVNELS